MLAEYHKRVRKTDRTEQKDTAWIFLLAPFQHLLEFRFYKINSSEPNPKPRLICSGSISMDNGIIFERWGIGIAVCFSYKVELAYWSTSEIFTFIFLLLGFTEINGFALGPEFTSVVCAKNLSCLCKCNRFSEGHSVPWGLSALSFLHALNCYKMR